jgi:hypothetical protein
MHESCTSRPPLHAVVRRPLLAFLRSPFHASAIPCRLAPCRALLALPKSRSASRLASPRPRLLANPCSVVHPPSRVFSPPACFWRFGVVLRVEAIASRNGLVHPSYCEMELVTRSQRLRFLIRRSLLAFAVGTPNACVERGRERHWQNLETLTSRPSVKRLVGRRPHP